MRLKERKHRLQNTLTDEVASDINQQVQTLQQEYQLLETRLMSLRDNIARDQLIVKAMDNSLVTINFEDILQINFNNQMNVIDKLKLFLFK